MTNDSGEFRTRFRMNVFLGGVLEKKIKSHSLPYIMSVREDYKSKYTPLEVEFRIIESKVKKVAKPRYVGFSNLPDWAYHYGVNAQNEYYGANKDYSKIRKLKAVY